MKKIAAFYIIYLAVVWFYFLFFYPLDTLADSRYAAMAHALFFSMLPLEALFLYLFFRQRGSDMLAAFAEKTARKEWLRTGLFAFGLVALYEIIRLPFGIFWFLLSHQEGISRQTWPDWLYERGLDLLLFWLALSLGLYLVRRLMHKFPKRWWLMLWLLALPAAVFVVYVQPVWIDPLYQEFTPLEEGSLRAAIEELTREAGIENATLLQVNMSEDTTTLNAYVTGIFESARIVVWDTTVAGMEQDEILFILAHEIGHYVMNHVYLGTAGYLILSFFLLLAVSFLYPRVWKGINKNKVGQSRTDLRAMPVLLLIVSLLLTALQPVSLYVSRQIETAADRYAVETTENLKAGVDSYERLARQSKSDISPAVWIKWWRYSHPTIRERIQLVKEEAAERET